MRPQKLNHEAVPGVLDVDLQDLQNRALHLERRPEPVVAGLLRRVESLEHLGRFLVRDNG
jgi:hypothetical protein